MYCIHCDQEVYGALSLSFNDFTPCPKSKPNCSAERGVLKYCIEFLNLKGGIVYYFPFLSYFRLLQVGYYYFL